MGFPSFTCKTAPSLWPSTPPNTPIPQPTPLTTPNGIQIQSVVFFSQFTHQTDQQTDQQTDWHMGWATGLFQHLTLYWLCGDAANNCTIGRAGFTYVGDNFIQLILKPFFYFTFLWLAVPFCGYSSGHWCRKNVLSRKWGPLNLWGHLAKQSNHY